MKRLYRSRDERMIAGVAGGIAEYLAVDPTLARAAFVLFTLVGGWGLLAYLILAVIMPLEPAGRVPMREAMEHMPPAEETRKEVQESRMPETPYQP